MCENKRIYVYFYANMYIHIDNGQSYIQLSNAFNNLNFYAFFEAMQIYAL